MGYSTKRLKLYTDFSASQRTKLFWITSFTLLVPPNKFDAYSPQERLLPSP